MGRKHIVFIGDSLTEWFDWQRRFPDHDVTNLGISGETVEDLLARRDLVRSLVRDPDVVFLMTGINNILQERFGITEPYREVVRNYTTWWKGATVVVQSLLPVEYAWVNNDRIRDINRQLAAIALEYGARYLDVYAVFVEGGGNVRPGLLSDDGVHLAGRGYEVWAQEVEKSLKR